MIYKNVEIHLLLEIVKERSIICFGAGKQLLDICNKHQDSCFFENIDVIVDNHKDSFVFQGTEKPVYRIEQCLEFAEKKPVILVTPSDCIDIIEQLEQISQFENCDLYVYEISKFYVRSAVLPKRKSLNEPIKIPKTIHYCWFGGKPIPDIFVQYIKSWEKYCPDYKIVRWDESNYDYKKNEYMYDAYNQNKFGFVPDFARLDILYNYGGVYLDTDVELIRNIDDLLCSDAFCGFTANHTVAYGLGFGAVAGFSHLLDSMSMYQELSFINSDGSLNITPGPDYETDLWLKKGLKQNNKLQIIHGMTFYPSDVLSPECRYIGNLAITENTYSIHHYSSTWFDNEMVAQKNDYKYQFNKLRNKLGATYCENRTNS